MSLEPPWSQQHPGNKHKPNPHPTGDHWCWSDRSYNQVLHLAGAVAVRLRVHDSGLLFISSHLSSGEHEGDELKRNYDFSEIVRRGYFADEFSALDPSVLGAHQQHAGVSKVSSEIIVSEHPSLTQLLHC